MTVAAPEWSHIVPVSDVGRVGSLSLVADEAARQRLASRMMLESLDSLDVAAELTSSDAGILLSGHVRASVTQSCAATGLPVPADIDEEFRLLFVDAAVLAQDAARDGDDDETELAADDCDIMPIVDQRIDVAEAAVQTLILALPPFPRHRDADRVLRERGVKSEGEAGAFGALAALIKDQR